MNGKITKSYSIKNNKNVIQFIISRILYFCNSFLELFELNFILFSNVIWYDKLFVDENLDLQLAIKNILKKLTFCADTYIGCLISHG